MGFRPKDSQFRVWGLGFRASVGLRACSLRLKACVIGPSIWGFGLRTWASVKGLGEAISNKGSNSRPPVSGMISGHENLPITPLPAAE